MGFKIYGDAEFRQPNTKTYLQMIKEVMHGTGTIPPTTVAGEQSKHAIVAGASVKRALSRIWSAAHWDWRVNWVGFEMENGVFMYDLPFDYEWHLTGPLNVANRYGLQHVTYETLLSMYPALAYAGPELISDVGEAPGGLSHVANLQLGMSDNSFYGKPRYWGIRGGKLFLFEIPLESEYADGEWNDEKYFTFGYYVACKDLVDNGEIIPIPPNLNDALYFLASAYFKQAFEFPDYAADEGRGEAMLRLAVNRNKLLHPEDAYSHIKAWVSPWGPHYGA